MNSFFEHHKDSIRWHRRATGEPATRENDLSDAHLNWSSRAPQRSGDQASQLPTRMSDVNSR
jgi:hypothetical protein